MRMLAAIAHYGSKNRPYLDRFLEALRSMDHEVSIVVLSEAPKSFPDDVEVRVGLPTSNPWSLPFAHRSLFVDRREDFDLFLYAEDDTLVEQRHIDAFLELCDILPDTLLPGFTRYEVGPEGRSLSEFHSYYRWDPASVCRVQGLTFAELTNHHSALYLLTRDQLAKAIASGGFGLEPHEGRYDMLVSAATDPYTQCGFTKVLCLDRFEDALVHHLPNVYVGKFGVLEEEARVQVEALRRVADGELDGGQLFDPELSPPLVDWSRSCYPEAAPGILEMVPRGADRVLSIGCTTGVTEAPLVERGIEVTGIPLDAVLGEVARNHGMRVLGPSLEHLTLLAGEPPFDAVLAVDVLTYLEDPVDALRAAGRLLAPDGRLVATVPDLRRYRLRNRLPGATHRSLPASFDADRIHPTDPRVVRRWLSAAGLRLARVIHRRATRREPVGQGGLMGRLWGNTLAVEARRGDVR